MTFTVRQDGDTGTVTLVGRFTFQSHKSFKAATDPLLEAGDILNIHLDLAGLEDMDASSLGMLLVLREKAGLRGKTVVLLAPAPCAQAVLEAAQFGKVFRIGK